MDKRTDAGTAAALEALNAALGLLEGLKQPGAEAADLRPRVADLAERLLAAKEALLRAREEFLALREELAKARAAATEPAEPAAEFDGKVYWKRLAGGTREGPYCQRCFDVERRWVRLHEQSRTQDFGGKEIKFLLCVSCKTTYDLD